MAFHGVLKRYALILDKVRQCHFPNFEEIREFLRRHGFEVSSRTLQRDIEQIRREFQIEIGFNRTKGGYYLVAQSGQTVTAINDYGIKLFEITPNDSIMDIPVSPPAVTDFLRLSFTSPGVFELGIYGPEVATGSLKIASPTIGDLFAFGESINFIGSQTGTVTNIEWLDNGVIFAQGLSASKSDLSPGTHTITLRGTVGGVAASVKQATGTVRSQVSGNTVSDSITIKIFDSIIMKNLDAPSGIDPFADNASVSYRAAETRFQAIGCVGNTEIAPAFANWEIQGEGGKVNTPLRMGVLNNLGVSVMRIGNIDGQETVSKKSTVTFKSYLPSTLSGPIKLVAKRGSLPPVSVVIRIKQPTVKINVKYVNGLKRSPVNDIPIWVQAAKDIWGQEKIIDLINSGSYDGINNPSPPFTALASDQSGEYLLPPPPSFLNPIDADEIALKYFGSNVISRQVEKLFEKRVADKDVINFFVTDNFYGVEYVKKGAKEIPRLDPQMGAGTTISSACFHKRDSRGFDISDKDEGGIILATPQPGLPDSFRRLANLTLAHELGHMLLHQGGNIDHDAPMENLMYPEQDFMGENLKAEQFKIVLDYDRKKGPEIFFFVEK